MSRHPPVTDADRAELARALLAVADRLEDIWAELAARGVNRPGTLAREAVEAFAEGVTSRCAVRDYWRELAKEKLSALDSPLDIFAGHYVAPYGYRSDLIAALRAQAHLLPASETWPSREIEPALRAWDQEDYTGDSARERLSRTIEASERAAAQACGVDNHPEFAASGWRARMALQRERYAAHLAPEGFRLVAPSRNFTMFQRPSASGKYVYHLLDDSTTRLEDGGSLECQFVVTWPGTRITSAQLFATRMIAIWPETLVPMFRYSRGFDRDDWHQLCGAVDSLSGLATTLFRRLDEELERLRPG